MNPKLSLLLVLGCLAACGSEASPIGGSPAAVLPPAAPAARGEVEGNDTLDVATAVPPGTWIVGDLLDADDVDFLSFEGREGDVATIEILATRFDQAGWAAAGALPEATVYAPGGSPLTRHDVALYRATGWGARVDLDFPGFRLPATGSYGLGLRPVDPDSGLAVPGARYAARVTVAPIGSAHPELEPVGATGFNDDAASAEPLHPGVTWGWWADGGADYYRVAVSEPTVLRFQVCAYRNGIGGADDGYFDADLILYDQDGTSVLREGWDSHWYDPAITYAVTVPGTYYLRLTQYQCTGDRDYLLTFEAFPMGGDPAQQAAGLGRDVVVAGTVDAGEPDILAFNGTAGECVAILLLDDDTFQGSAGRATLDVLEPDGVTVRPHTRGSHGMHYERVLLGHSGTHYLRISAPAEVRYALRIETWRSGTWIGEGAPGRLGALPIAGAIGEDGDVDAYDLEAEAGSVVVLDLYGGHAAAEGYYNLHEFGSRLEPGLLVRGPDGSIVAESRNDVPAAIAEAFSRGGPTLTLSFLAGPGPYTVEIQDLQGRGGSDRTYLVARR